MDFRHEAESWLRMTPAQRVQYCKALSEETRRLAQHVDDELRPLYLELATQWLAIAEEIAKLIR